MLSGYIRSAMRRATYEILSDAGGKHQYVVNRGD
jgi:hypothetical protein